jgi:hypothetical protein
VHDVAYLVALTDSDDIAEVVGDDTEMVTVVTDVSRQEPAVTPAEDDLLAPIRCLPIHFHVELIRLYQTRRLGQSFAYLCQEEDESVRARAVARERRVCLNGQPALNGSLYQRERFGGVPGLGVER